MQGNCVVLSLPAAVVADGIGECLQLTGELVVVEADSGLHPRQSAASVRQIGREHECEAEEKKLSMDFRQETPATRACIWKLEKLESKHAEKRANASI